MRILYVTDFLPHTRSDQGGAKALDWYMRAMAARGHTVSLLALCQIKDAPYANSVAELWQPSDIIPVPDTRARRMRSFVGSLLQTEARAYCISAGFLPHARQFLLHHPADVIHIVHPWLMGLVADVLPAGRRSGTRLVGHVIDITTEVLRLKLRNRVAPRLLKDYAWAALTEAGEYSRMDVLLTHAPSDTEWIARRVPRSVSMVESPIWFDAIAHIVSEPPPKSATQDFLVVGTSADPRFRDGVDWLVAQVWPSVKARCPGARLQLVSVRPEHQSRWAGVEGVMPLPYVDDLLALYDRSVALVFPLQGGGYSRHLKVLNALARGVPVVMTSDANASERLHNDSESAIRDTAAGFVEAMTRLVSEPSYGRRLAHGGLAKLQRDYGSSDLARDMERIYLP